MRTNSAINWIFNFIRVVTWRQSQKRTNMTIGNSICMWTAHLWQDRDTVLRHDVLRSKSKSFFSWILVAKWPSLIGFNNAKSKTHVCTINTNIEAVNCLCQVRSARLIKTRCRLWWRIERWNAGRSCHRLVSWRARHGEYVWHLKVSAHNGCIHEARYVARYAVQNVPKSRLAVTPFANPAMSTHTCNVTSWDTCTRTFGFDHSPQRSTYTRELMTTASGPGGGQGVGSIITGRIGLWSTSASVTSRAHVREATKRGLRQQMTT